MHRPAALAPQLLLDGGQQQASDPLSAVAGLDAELVQQRLFLYPDIEDVSSDGRCSRSSRSSRSSRINAREEETRVGLPAEAAVERQGLRGGESAAFDAGDLGEHGGGGVLAEAAQVEDLYFFSLSSSLSFFGVVGGHRSLAERSSREDEDEVEVEIDRR